MHVPFIISCLGKGIPIEKNRLDDRHFISGVDLFPTICDYAGIDIPERCHGKSLRPLAEGKDIPWRDYAYIESNYWGRSIVTDDYKYITEYKPKVNEDFVPPGPDSDQLGLVQLFDRHNDLSETVNLADSPEYQDVINSCREKLLEHESQLNRRQIEHRNAKRAITNWGNRLREYWEDGK